MPTICQTSDQHWDWKVNETCPLPWGVQHCSKKKCSYKIKSLLTMTQTGVAPNLPLEEEDGRLILKLRIDKTPPRLPHANQYTLPPSAPSYRTFQLMELPSSIPPWLLRGRIPAVLWWSRAFLNQVVMSPLPASCFPAGSLTTGSPRALEQGPWWTQACLLLKVDQLATHEWHWIRESFLAGGKKKEVIERGRRKLIP